MDFDPKETDVKYCGIDLHSNNSVVIVGDEEDRMTAVVDRLAQSSPVSKAFRLQWRSSPLDQNE
jgi:hypothetical protein